MTVTFTKGPDYAIARLRLNGRPIGEPVDLCSPIVVRAKPMAFGVYELKARDQRIDVEIVGHNPSAKPRYTVGVDEVAWTPAE